MSSKIEITLLFIKRQENLLIFKWINRYENTIIILLVVLNLSKAKYS